ncbi:hypothetical protein AX17_002403 [Amanita inopinata Kibby_2008]|nr:hypothetical protein AX17_002403 [Amanita inopinata Kibby_2008]
MSVSLHRTPAVFCVSHWPCWLSRWVGYRTVPPKELPEHISLLWNFLGAFCGIALIQAIFGKAKSFVALDVPPIVYSYGSVVVMTYATIDSPLAQPRALLGGHFIGALIGVSLTKLFYLIRDEERFEEVIWILASLCCATTIVLMQITDTMHPPGGATAVLAAVNPRVRHMGWLLLPVILVSSLLLLVVALLLNNIQRQYPTHWTEGPDKIEDSHTPDIDPRMGLSGWGSYSDTTLAGHNDIAVPDKAHLSV